MTDRIERIEITGEGLTVSRLIWNRFQAVSDSTLGEIYDLNPGLAGSGTHIPIGTVVLVPIPDTSDDRVVEQITLWS